MTTFLLALTFSLAEEDAAAKKLFDSMEKKLAGAKSVKLEFTGKMNWDDRQAKFDGSLIVANGNKYRLVMTAMHAGKKREVNVACDGKQISAVRDGKTKTFAAPPDVAKWLRVSIGRSGITLVLLLDINITKPRGDNLRNAYTASDFQLGKTASVGKRKARILKYKLTRQKLVFHVTAWIDTKTGLPLKRTFRQQGKDNVLTETTTWTLNPKLDEKTFKLPEVK